MKKIVGLLAAVAVYNGVSALPVYNPAEPELLAKGLFFHSCSHWGLELGYRGDFVFDRKMKIKHTSNIREYVKDVCDYSTSINAAQLTLNLWDRVDLYGWVGAAHNEFEAQGCFNTEPFIPVILSTITGSSHDGLAFGFGARGVLWSCGRTAIGADVQYSRSRAKLECFAGNEIPVQNSVYLAGTTTPADPSDFSLCNYEFQASLGISYRICRLIPYLAVKYSYARSKLNAPAVTPVQFPAVFNPYLHFQNRGCVGFVVGATLVAAEACQVTAEGRFIDERALTITADFRF